jgi:hypothetical protein
MRKALRQLIDAARERPVVPALLALSLATMIWMLPHAVGARPAMKAHFEKRDTTFTDMFETGPEGGTFTVPVRGKPTDRASFQVPEKAVDRVVRLSVGYCTGKTRLAAGTPSDVVLVLKAIPDVEFQRPVRITAVFPPDRRYLTVVGYSIDREGHFRPIDLAERDMAAGRVSFLTFRPLTLTWAYVER